MKIAIFSDTFYPQINGVSHFVFHLAESLAKRGHEVRVFAATSLGKNEVNDLSQYGFELEKIPSIPALVYPGERLSVPVGWSFRKLRKFKPDVIHTHTPFSVGWEAVLGAKILNIPLVGEHHTFYDDYLEHVKLDYEWTRKLSWKMTAGYYNKCDVVISPTKKLADSLIEAGLKKPTEIISNSVNTDFFRPLSQKERDETRERYGIKGPSLVYMGRISYEKNIAQVIRSFSVLLERKSMEEVRLMLVGDGPERGKLEKLIREKKLEKKIIWTGALRGDELRKAIGCNDIFITASKSENMPLSVLEAMACGLPVVAVGERGLIEIVENGKNGYLSSSDSSKELADKITDILSDRDKKIQFGVFSRELSQKYSQERVMLSFEECYERLLKKHNSKL
jgi:glycosyltransferase involved in cell wall biosynthesis